MELNISNISDIGNIINQPSGFTQPLINETYNAYINGYRVAMEQSIWIFFISLTILGIAYIIFVYLSSRTDNFAMRNKILLNYLICNGIIIVATTMVLIGRV